MISKLPWKVKPHSVLNSSMIESNGITYVASDLHNDDAKYIVKACNMFPELVDALEKAKEAIESAFEVSTRMQNADMTLWAAFDGLNTMTKIDELLNKVKGE